MAAKKKKAAKLSKPGKAKKPAAKGKAVARKAAVKAVAPKTSAGAGHNTLHAVSQFLFRQAEILDGKRWSDFIDLFTPDGVYWMPADPADTTWDGVPAIFAEDHDIMTVRMNKVQHPHAWGQAPIWGTSHIVGNIMIEKEDARTGDLVVHSRFHMMEFRRDESRHFAGTYVHHLKKVGSGYRIKLQRVDLVNGQGTFDYVLQVWV